MTNRSTSEVGSWAERRRPAKAVTSGDGMKYLDNLPAYPGMSEDALADLLAMAHARPAASREVLREAYVCCLASLPKPDSRALAYLSARFAAETRLVTAGGLLRRAVAQSGQPDCPTTWEKILAEAQGMRS